MATLVRWSVFARPANPKRMHLMLPKTWPSSSNDAPTKNRANVFANAEKTKLASLLAIPLLEDIVTALLSDRNAWNLDFDATETEVRRNARWMAERMVLWLYDLGCNSSQTLNIQDLALKHQEGRRMRNAFLDAHPYIDEAKDTFELRTHDAPDGSVSVWAALFAFNVVHFAFSDAMETFELSKQFDHIMVDLCKAESTATCEAALILASRLREHAAINLLLETGKLVQKCNPQQLPSLKGLIRRNGDWQTRVCVPKQPKEGTNFLDLLTLVGYVIGNMVSYRLLLAKADLLNQISILIRCQGVLASSRTLSFSMLCLTDNENLFKAIRMFEAAAVEEVHAFERLLSSNDILVASLEEELLEEDTEFVAMIKSPLRQALRRSWLRVGLLLNSPRFEDQLFKNVSALDRLRVESLFDSALPAAKTSTSETYAAFYNILMSWWSKKQDMKAHEAIASVIRDRDAYEMFEALLKTTPALDLLTQNKHVIDLPCEFSLKRMQHNLQKESTRRAEISGPASSLNDAAFSFFETMQFTESEMQNLADLAKTRGWES